MAILELDCATQRSTQKAWQVLLTESDVLGKALTRLKWCLDENPEGTISVSKKYMKINPIFWSKMTLRERVFLLAHEACHVLQNTWSPKLSYEMLKEPKRLNLAKDCVVNGILSTADVNMSQYLSDRLYKTGVFPQKLCLACDETLEFYFEKIGPQEEDQNNNGKNDQDDEDDQDGKNDQDGEGSEGQDKLEEEEMNQSLRSMSVEDSLCKKIIDRMTQNRNKNCIHNWKEILQAFLWRRAKEERSRKRPSRRWDGKGVVIPGKSNRVFPKTVLILDYSGSMEEMISACAETVTNLIKTFNMCETHVIACNRDVVYEWVLNTNAPTPSTEELLLQYTGGGTDMMPAIKRAKELGAELIFCVSDMQVPTDNITCDEVFWITEKNNPEIEKNRKWFGNYFKKPVLDVLLTTNY